MSHYTTWICARCKQTKSSLIGSKFVMVGKYKRRVCPDCLTK